MLIPSLISDATERYSAMKPAPAASNSSAGPAAGKKRQLGTASPGSEFDERRRARLNRTAATQTARSLVLAANASSNNARSQRDVIESLSHERLIGSNDLLDINFLELAIAVARGVGRVQVPEGFGTGFLVGPGLMLTNHHVIGTELDASRANLQLDYQDNAQAEILPAQTFRFDPSACFITDRDRDLDFTIVGVQPVSDKSRTLDFYPWTQLIPDVGKADVGDPINIIQHPRGGLKQIAFRENKILALSDAEPHFLFYTADTEPGSSGSPCFNDQWELIALHHSGVAKTDSQKRLLKKDGKLWQEGDDPAQLDWVANEGIHVSKIVAFLRAQALKPEWQDTIAKALTMQPPNPIERARSAGVNTSVSSFSGSPGAGTGSVSFSIPLQITLSLGGLSGAQLPIGFPLPGVLVTPPLAPEEITVTIDQDYRDRQGYNPNFLDLKVPLPEIAPSMITETSQVSGDAMKHSDPYELTYYHYSVYMNKRRRTAWFSAANVDGVNRPDIGKRPADRWYVDPRIPASDQLSQDAFEPGIDRGHLTRRQDTVWGPDFETALKANNDTFHFTNCSLQVSAFNRGKDRWQGLEQFLLEQHALKEKKRLNVVTGPVFADNDPVYRNASMSYSVRVPLQFWKVCTLIRQDNTLSATAFVLGQEDIEGLPGFQQEVFAVDLAQTTIKDLEARTGLNLGDLRNHDYFAAGGAPGTLEVARPDGVTRLIKPILNFEDVVV